MEIKPTYVTFEQAKLLKEKGFDIECRNYYDNSEEICEVSNRFTKNMNSLQTAFLEIAVFPEDADINDKDFIVYSAPEQWQVVEWLRVKHGIWVFIDWSQNKWCSQIIDIKEETLKKVCKNKDWKERNSAVYLKTLLDYNSPQEAYSAAFDYILNNLI